VIVIRRHLARGLELLLSVAVAACGAAGAPSPPTSIETPYTTVFPTTSGPTIAAPTRTPAAAPLEPAPPSATPEVVSFEPIQEPPGAAMFVEGGDPVVGELGSFTWMNGGSDSPWLPGYRIHVANGEVLTVTLAESIGIANWTAGRVRLDNLDGGAVGIGQGLTDRIIFPAPPPGIWSVSVNVWFADNLGSASYYWAVTVD
jgi:hypothetical protein